MQVIKIFFSRWIGGLVASLCAWLAIKWGIVVPDTVQADLAANVVGVMLGVFSILYPLIHKVIDRKVNPGDTASTHLNKELKARAEVARREY